MAGYRNIFFKTVGHFASTLPPKLLQRISGQKLILPFYHIISVTDCLHIKHLYPVKSVAAFNKDLDFLLKHYQAIDYSTFSKVVAGEIELKKPSFLLSFDDGLREFNDLIAPILWKKGIPAMCFLNSDFIDNKGLFYRYKASLLIEEFNQRPELVNQCKSHFKINTSLETFLLEVNYLDKQQLDEIAQFINYSFDAFLKKEKPYLDSDQIRSLIAKGFSFGAHSKDHPKYELLSITEQIKQTKESIKAIQDTFGLSYKLFSFPFTDHGVGMDYFDEINAKQITDCTFGSAGQKKDKAINHYQRIPFEEAHLSAKAIHNTELLYYCLKKPLGKNRVHRK